jgi:hypothetical protein
MSEEREHQPGDADFTARVRGDLRRMVEQTDAATRARLDRMVDEALRTKRRKRRAIWVMWPVGAVTAGVVALLFAGRPSGVSMPAASATPAADVELLLNVDNFELLEQMEFYQWLDRQPGILDAAPTPAGSQRS